MRDCEYSAWPTCPHCNEQTTDPEYIPHDDGETQTIECGNCDRKFVTTASVSVDYESVCQPGEHNWNGIELTCGWAFRKCRTCGATQLRGEVSTEWSGD